MQPKFDSHTPRGSYLEAWLDEVEVGCLALVDDVGEVAAELCTLVLGGNLREGRGSSVHVLLRVPLAMHRLAYLSAIHEVELGPEELGLIVLGLDPLDGVGGLHGDVERGERPGS